MVAWALGGNVSKRNIRLMLEKGTKGISRTSLLGDQFAASTATSDFGGQWADHSICSLALCKIATLENSSAIAALSKLDLGNYIGLLDYGTTTRTNSIFYVGLIAFDIRAHAFGLFLGKSYWCRSAYTLLGADDIGRRNWLRLGESAHCEV
jgi:hypothetical protein